MNVRIQAASIIILVLVGTFFATYKTCSKTEFDVSLHNLHPVDLPRSVVTEPKALVDKEVGATESSNSTVKETPLESEQVQIRRLFNGSLTQQAPSSDKHSEPTVMPLDHANPPGVFPVFYDGTSTPGSGQP